MLLTKGDSSSRNRYGSHAIVGDAKLSHFYFKHTKFYVGSSKLSLVITFIITGLMAFVYSCCFWFSLRLGGILIGILSLGHATFTLVILCLAYKDSHSVKYEISEWLKNLNLLYMGGLLQNFLADPETYLSYLISICCIYIIFCLFYIYGAYTCNNILMAMFILAELIRLITLSIIATTWLLILKQNTMDIGLLIAASVASGFLLLGMFYLWICAANLPILINETEREEQKATIVKLQRLLEVKSHQNNYGKFDRDIYGRKPFFIPMTNNKYNSIREPYHLNFIN